MKTRIDRNFSGLPKFYSNGMTLLDVLLAIIIFVVGMLALASLQGNLARSSIDANARTVGTNLAEQIIEELRTYERLETATGAVAYQDIATHTRTEELGGVDYTVVVTVDDYYFLPDGVTVTDDPDDEGLPASQNTTISNFKNVTLDVSWTGNEFQIGDGTSTTGRLGTGNFTVSGIIPSIPVLDSASVAAADDPGKGTLDVPYNPGQAPDIIKIEVGDNRFRESTTPEPIVRRTDELVETWFDVVTFNLANPSLFLRREEFVAISCECTIRNGATALDGRVPTLWTGAEYKEGTFTQKTYGESATNQQSQYCDVCCQDHHDDSGSSVKYRPWMANNEYSDHFSGDHPHYNRNNKGEWVEAENDGDTYLEACRLVRKDGFFRVAQDFNLSEINVFPENYLGVGATEAYSNYVRAVANEELGSYDDTTADPLRPANQALDFDGDGPDLADRSAVPPVDSAASTTQLRSRGIYIDDLNSLLAANLDNCFGNGDRVDCEVPDATQPYELYPFFDLQLTHIARWFETESNNPIHISNEAINKNGYSRGLAELAGDEIGIATGTSKIETGNVGLISTLPITTVPAAAYTQGDIYLVAGDGSDPGGNDYPTVTGTFNNEGGTSDPEAATLTASLGVECTMPTNGVLECVFGEEYPGTAFLEITNYSKRNTDLYICSNNELMIRTGFTVESGTSGINSTVFELPAPGTTGVSITITKDPCPEP